MNGDKVLGLKDVLVALNSDQEFLTANGGKKLRYPTLLKWAQKGRFKTAQLINKNMWVVKEWEVIDWRNQLEFQQVSAVNYAPKGRRNWAEFYAHYVPLLAQEFPYTAATPADARKAALATLRVHHPWVPEGDEIVERTIANNPDFSDPAGYPRKILTRKLTQYYIQQSEGIKAKD